MAVLQIQYPSRALGHTNEVLVLLPESVRKETGKLPTIWLLHGAFGGHTDWLRKTMIELYAEQYGFAVVMASVENSLYGNIPSGRYYDLLTKELPDYLRGILPLSEKREENMVVGFSMGGHGAYKLALSEPEMYAGAVVFAAGSFAGMPDAPEGSALQDVHQYVFGHTHLANLKDTDMDVEWLAEELMKTDRPKPLLYACCGRDDMGFPLAEKTAAYMKELGLTISWKAAEGKHDWFFINRELPDAIDWCAGVMNLTAKE